MLHHRPTLAVFLIRPVFTILCSITTPGLIEALAVQASEFTIGTLIVCKKKVHDLLKERNHPDLVQGHIMTFHFSSTLYLMNLYSIH
jgi:hypothetical protein